MRSPLLRTTCLLGLALCLDCGGGGGASASAPASSSVSTPPLPPGAPHVYYTDLLSGPNDGGENGKGIYLSLFGKNFGSTGLGSTVKVYINDVEVDNYRYLGPSKGRPDIQQITVQIGALGHPTPGTLLPLKVVVNGQASNTDLTFTVNPGSILFVDNVAGNDATAAPGDITKPYRYVQTPALYTGGAWPAAQPGDVIVMRGKGTPWTDVGFEGYFMRYRDKSGSAPTGLRGTGPIAILGYPGEDVYIRGTVAGGMTGGGISAINGDAFPGLGKWAVVAGLRMDVEGYDGPISQEVYGDHWRVVNNDLAASTAATTGASAPKMAGITGNGQGSAWLGNHIHDIQGSEGEAHGIYIDGDGSYEIAYNHIENVRSGSGFQIYVNGGNGSTSASNVNFHHNQIHDVVKQGINLADGTKNGIQIWDNLVYRMGLAGLRLNTVDLHGAKIYNNTFYATNQQMNALFAVVTNTWNLPDGAMDVQNNIFVATTGTGYVGGTVATKASQAAFDHNLWFNGAGSPTLDAHPVLGDPQFVAAGSDFHLHSGSVAIGAGTSLSLVTTDYDLLRPRTTPMDLGALAYVMP